MLQAGHVPWAGPVTFRDVMGAAKARSGPVLICRGVPGPVVPPFDGRAGVDCRDERCRPARREWVAVVVARPLLARTSSKSYDSFPCHSSPAQAQTFKKFDVTN
jgi:hypothetical protein